MIKPLAKSFPILLGLTAATSAEYMEKYIKKILRSGNTTLIISNDGIEDIIKIAKSLEDSSLLLKGVTETVQNEVKEQKGGFLSMLLGTLDASLLGNLLPGRGINRAKTGRGINRACGRIVRVGYGNHSYKMVFNCASSFN